MNEKVVPFVELETVLIRSLIKNKKKRKEKVSGCVVLMKEEKEEEEETYAFLVCSKRPEKECQESKLVTEW